MPLNQLINSVKRTPVSVIIPCYNCIDTVERAVASVAAQTYLPEEVILVDDGSTDFTIEKLFELKNFYGKKWINVIRLKHNYGQAFARNLGWDAASEAYLSFLDADDSWHPRKIEIQLDWMISHPDVVMTAHRSIRTGTDNIPDFLLTDKFRTFQIKPFYLLLSNRFLTRTVMLYRNLPYRFNTVKRYSEDYLLWLEIVLNGYNSWYLDLPMAYSYKAPFGESGLTGNLLKMETGELDTYIRLHHKNLISGFSTCCLMGYSLLKYLRRLLISRGLGFEK